MGYDVSIPDLEGFAKQIDGLDRFYRDIEEQLQSSYVVEVVMSDFMGDKWKFDGSDLGGHLAKFKDEFLKLMTAEEKACERLGKGFGDTAELLRRTADEYRVTEEKAQTELDAADNSGDKADDDAKGIVDGITDGDPKENWKDKLEATDYLGFDSISGGRFERYIEMGYRGEMVEAHEWFTSVMMGDYVATFDSFIQWLFGISPVREAIKPFLGDWGFLYFMHDVYAAAAQAVDGAVRMMDQGVKLLAVHWTGDAADQFAEHCADWFKALSEHRDHLVAVSDFLEDMANEMDKHGEAVAGTVVDLMDSAIALYGTAQISKWVWKKVLKKAAEMTIILGALIGPISEGVNAAIGLAGLMEKETKDLRKEAKELKPPK